MASKRPEPDGDATTPKRRKYDRFDPPTRAKIKAECALIPHLSPSSGIRSKRDVFDRYGVGKTRGYEILNEDTERASTKKAKGRKGRPRLMSDEEVDRCIELLKTDRFQTRPISWESLIAEANLSCCVQTLRRAIKRRGVDHESSTV